MERGPEPPSQTARGPSVGSAHRSRGVRQEPYGQKNGRAPSADRPDSVGARSAISVVVVVPLCRVPGDVLVEVSQTPIDHRFFRRPRQTDVGMFQSIGWDRELFSESTAIHHDAFVTRRHGVEFCQKRPRVSALVDLGRLPPNDLEPPPHRRDTDDRGIERPGHINFSRRWSVFGPTTERRVQSTILG